MPGLRTRVWGFARQGSMCSVCECVSVARSIGLSRHHLHGVIYMYSIFWYAAIDCRHPRCEGGFNIIFVFLDFYTAKKPACPWPPFPCRYIIKTQ